MNCKEFSNLLDAYLDGALPREQAREMEAHAAECPACADLMAAMLDCRQEGEEIEVPDSFGTSWRQAIREECEMEAPKRKRNGWQKWLAAAAALVVVLGGTALTRNAVPRSAQRDTPAGMPKQSTSDYGSLRAAGGAMTNFSYDVASTPEYASGADMLSESGAAESAHQEKIIRTASIALKTLSFEDTLSTIRELTAEYGGREEYFYQSGDTDGGELRRANLTLRIPVGSLDDFLGGAQAYAQTTSITQTSEDVSDSYYDIQSRLEVQQQKLARLQKLMESAENVTDLIDIESAIADTQYYIDRYTGQLKGYDSKADYSTVDVNIREIRLEESEEIGLGQRIQLGLEKSLKDGVNFLEDMAIFLVSAAPWLAAVAVVVMVVRCIVKKKKHQKGREK